MMKRGQVIGAAVGLFVIAGAIGLGVGRLAPSATVRQIGQTDVLEGYDLFNQANHELALNHHANADAASSEAAGYLFSAVTPLQSMGIDYASGITTYLQGAEYDVVHGTASAKQRAVLRTFHQAFTPLAHYQFGQIPEASFQSALSRVNSAINR